MRAQPKELHVVEQEQNNHQFDSALGQQVMEGLGQPDDLQKVMVRRLWENHYRVNVVVGAGEFSNRIAHSYFLVADGDGKIIASTPKITKKY